MEFFGLPLKCKIDKNISKEIIYRNADADEKLKRIFIDNVIKIRFFYSLTMSNTNIEKYIRDGEKYEEINFLKIILKQKGKEKIILRLLHQLIPKSTVILLEFENEILISLSKKKIKNQKIILEELYNTKWLNREANLENFKYKNLNSRNLKLFYEDMIDKVRILNIENNFENIKNVKIENLDEVEKLNKEIENLKVIRKKETQINKIVEIQSEILKKIEKRNLLLKN